MLFIEACLISFDLEPMWDEWSFAMYVHLYFRQPKHFIQHLHKLAVSHRINANTTLNVGNICLSFAFYVALISIHSQSIRSTPLIIISSLYCQFSSFSSIAYYKIYTLYVLNNKKKKRTKKNKIHKRVELCRISFCGFEANYSVRKANE